MGNLEVIKSNPQNYGQVKTFNKMSSIINQINDDKNCTSKNYHSIIGYDAKKISIFIFFIEKCKILIGWKFKMCFCGLYTNEENGKFMH